MASYLRQVKEVWDHIIGADEDARLHLDSNTVFHLQGLCPQATEDRVLIESRREGIFPMIQQRSRRKQLWERLYSVRVSIPSIHTFLEDTKYLEPCSKVLRLLLPTKTETTVRRSFQAMHNGQVRLKIQSGESSSQEQDEPTSNMTEWKGYRQLWLYSMRHFHEMTTHAPRLDGSKAKAPRSQGELIWWCHLHDLARSSGYVDVCANILSTAEADMQMSADFLRRVRPKSMYGLSGDAFDNTVRDMVKLIQWVKPSPPLIEERYGLPRCPTDIAHRCGVPFEQSFSEVRNWLFLPQIYDESERQDYFTSFDVKKDMFYRFFGALRAEDTDRDRCSPMEIERDSTKTPTAVLDVESQAMVPALQTLAGGADLDSELPHWADHLPRGEALHHFRNYSRQPLSGRVVIINRATDGRYTLKTYNRDDTIGITNHVSRPEDRTHVSHVVDPKNIRRTKITTLQDFIEGRDPCILRVPHDCDVLSEFDDETSHSACQQRSSLPAEST